jgi:hypothetical protein
MSEQEYHEMILETVHQSGAEEWYCPTCGRRFLMQWPPAYNKCILEMGDETAIHSGGKGDIQMGSMQIDPNDESISQENDPIPIDEAALQPWMEWMEKINFEAFWDRTIEE